MTNTISAVVNFVEGKSAKCRYATEITIKMGGLNIATATLGGRWSQSKACSEFKRNPNVFTPCSGIKPETVKSIAQTFKVAA